MGGPKAWDLWQAAERFGVWAETVDLLDGRWQHDVSSPRVFEELLRNVQGGAFDVVWLAPPCSSFSVLHLRALRKRLRARAESEGVQGLSERMCSLTMRWRRARRCRRTQSPIRACTAAKAASSLCLPWHGVQLHAHSYHACKGLFPAFPWK